MATAHLAYTNKLCAGLVYEMIVVHAAVKTALPSELALQVQAVVQPLLECGCLYATIG